jgi:hypothetical protein
VPYALPSVSDIGPYGDVSGARNFARRQARGADLSEAASRRVYVAIYNSGGAAEVCPCRLACALLFRALLMYGCCDGVLKP